MSILNGAISGRIVRPAPMPYGQPLEELSFLPLAGCSDIAVSPDGGTLYVAGKGRLLIFDLKEGERPRLIGHTEDIGAARQLAVADGTAYITTRPGGLFIADVSVPEAPRVLKQVDTLELATGVWAGQGLCLVTDRHMGVEIWDVSRPEKPVYLSSFRAGEAQSVYVDRGYAYAGDWMNRRVHVVDIREPDRPHEVSSFMLDGFADGLFVKDGLCLAAGGHHGLRLKNRREYEKYTFVTPDMLENGYGTGHGLTLYDVSDPEAPEYLAEVKFPPLYVPGHDTWRVTASGSYAYVSDTYNGLFVVNISDVLNPVIEAHFRLPPLTHDMALTPPFVQKLCQPVAGVVPAMGRLFAAGYESGLHELAFAPAEPVQPSAPAKSRPRELAVRRVFACGGQVHAVAEADGCLLAACGDDGLFALDADDFHVLHHLETRRPAHDVTIMNGLICAAEGLDGVAAYRFSREAGFELCCRCAVPGEGVRQIVALDRQGRLAVEIGATEVGFVRLDESGLTFEKAVSAGGLLYHHHLCPVPHPDGWLCAVPLSTGPVWLDIEKQEKTGLLSEALRSFCPFEAGIAVKGRDIIVIHDRGYGVIDDVRAMPDAFAPENMSSVEGAKLAGQPFVLGDTLVLVNRASGYVERLDISDVRCPVFMDCAVVPGRPESAVRLAGRDYIACGHEGLFVIGE